MISAYCIDEITIIKHEGRTDHGEPLATTDVPVKGKIEYKTKLVRNIAGEQVVSSAMVLFPESINVNLERELTHEDRLKFDGVEHVILRIDKPKAFSGPIYEVYIV